MATAAVVDAAGTRRVAHGVAPLLIPGDVVELIGVVGAGKTTFVGMLAEALDCLDAVRSPTYTIANAYQLRDGTQLAHLDLYRTPGKMDAAAWGDIEPYFEDGIACIEWPEPAREWLRGRPVWQIELRSFGMNARVIEVQAPARVSGEELSAALAGAWS